MSASRRLVAAALWIGLACTLPTSRAGAQADTPATEAEATARALFDEGVALSDQERWGEAVERFRRSWALRERPSTAFNLAVALLRLGRPSEGLGALDDYLRTSDPEAEAERRAEARALLETALGQISHVTLTVTPTMASVRVDGVPVGGEGVMRELRLDPGPHAVLVEAEGYEPEAFSLSVLGGERIARPVSLARQTEPSGPARLRVTSSLASARILVDGEEVGLGTYVDELAPGRHEIEVRADGYVSFRRTLDLEAGERRDLQASLTRRELPLEEDPVFWILTGAIAAVVGAGVAIGVALGPGREPPYGGNTSVVLQGLHATF